MSSFWLMFWAVCLAPAWLLPNHYPPWTAFHLDAWAAGAMLLPALWLFVRSNATTPWAAGQVLLLTLVAVIWFQYGAGLIVHAGTAWVNTAYLLGFLVAWQTGSLWESADRGQAIDGVMLAIGLAAFASVGLQLHQWFGLDRLDIWSMGGSSGRPYANLGQPNQLSTLLIWGLLAIIWALLRRRIRPSIAVAGAVFVAFGLALTGSRTAWLAIVLLNVAFWCWRGYWPNPKARWVVVALTLYFFALAFSIDVLPRILMLLRGAPDYYVSDIVRSGTETRPAIWAIFLDAAWQRPWWGYGWGQTAMANSEVVLAHPSLHGFFSHAHNLFLDLVIWCGLPLGLAVSAYLGWWLVSRALRVRCGEDAILMMVFLMMGNHAMLELPLHYAYFLLPIGVFMGALDVRLGIQSIWAGSRWLRGAIVLSAAACLVLVVRDYSRVETSFQNLRFEWARIKSPPTQVPDVLLLTQWQNFVRMAKLDEANLSTVDVRWMQDMSRLYPMPGFFQLTAIRLAQLNQPVQAGRTLEALCRMSPQTQCAGVQRHWVEIAAKDAMLAKVPWPANRTTPP